MAFRGLFLTKVTQPSTILPNTDSMRRVVIQADSATNQKPRPQRQTAKCPILQAIHRVSPDSEKYRCLKLKPVSPSRATIKRKSHQGNALMALGPSN